MGRTWFDDLREAEQRGERWVRERQVQAAQLEHEAALRGQAAWDAAVRKAAELAGSAGRAIKGNGPRPTPALNHRKATAVGVDKAGAARREPQGSSRPASWRQTNSAAAHDILREVLLQRDAVVRPAVDILTVGNADRIAAAANALPGSPDGWRERYETNLAAEKAHDRYDAQHRPIARQVGNVGGTLWALGARAPLMVASRIKGAVSLTARDTAALLAAGGGSGVATQFVADRLSGKKSTLGDKAGAALGGVVGVAATRLFGGRTGGAADGWTTSAAQDLFNGRVPSLERAGQSATAGGLLGGLSGRIGRNASNSLPPRAKGWLGEAMGDVRSTINGRPRQRGPKQRDELRKGYWVPDGRSGDIRFEDKFGYRARLTPNQKRAMAELGPNFWLNHFTPDDIGRLIALPVSGVGPQIVDERNRAGPR